MCHARLLYEPCPIFYSGTVIHVSLHHTHLSVSRKKRRDADISTQRKRQGQIGKEELARCRLSFWSGADGHAQQSPCPSRLPTSSTLLSGSSAAQEKPALFGSQSCPLRVSGEDKALTRGWEAMPRLCGPRRTGGTHSRSSFVGLLRGSQPSRSRNASQAG